MTTYGRLTGLALLALAALFVTSPAFAAGQCSFDFYFTETGSGDVQITVLADCSPYTVHQTNLSASSPNDFGFSSQPGGSATVVLDGEPGSQQYCGNATASYYVNGIATLDDSQGSDCATF